MKWEGLVTHTKDNQRVMPEETWEHIASVLNTTINVHMHHEVLGFGGEERIVRSIRRLEAHYEEQLRQNSL